MTTYTVMWNDGDSIQRGLSLREAAAEILTSDSREWEIREMEKGGWRLWSRQQVANMPWTSTVVFSFAATREEAEDEIFTEVVGSEWPGHKTAMADEAYDEMLADDDA